MNSYQDLKVWQLGIEVAKQVYQLTARFPKHELFALANQAQRAAVSIPSNIAEGHARDSTKEYLHHLSIARGSLAELETVIILAREFGYLQPGCYERIMPIFDELSRMLRGLQNALRRKINEVKLNKPRTTSAAEHPRPSSLDPRL